MLVITSKIKDKIFSGIRPRLITISLLIAAILILLLNFVPTYMMKYLCCREEEKTLLQHAEYLSERLDDFPLLRATDVKQKLGTYPSDGTTRVLVIDASTKVLFDSSIYDNLQGQFLLISGIKEALSGDEFSSARMDKSGVESYVITPIRTNRVVGAVYVWHRNQAAISVFEGIHTVLFWLSILLGIGLLAVMLLFSTDLTQRLRKLITGIRRVQNGAYGEQLPCEGKDELTILSSELNELSRQILETEELRRTFVSDASHELRTPLSSIRLLTDSIIQTENIDMETTKEFLADIGEEIDRLTRIAERLLILTRLDGAKKLVLEPVNLKKVVESVIATLEPTAQEAEVRLEYNLAENCVFLGNADGAYQVVFNLVENAIKYNRRGGTVRVLLFVKEQQCHIIVDDNGIGIPEQDYARIFERFYRVDKARSRSGKGGTGLGLSIVAKTVENYKGTIQVEPSVEGGTRFTVIFPQNQEGAIP